MSNLGRRMVVAVARPVFNFTDAVNEKYNRGCEVVTKTINGYLEVLFKGVVAMFQLLLVIISTLAAVVVMLWIPIMLLSLFGGITGFVVAGIIVWVSMIIFSLSR